MSKTIAAIATPMGAGAVSIIRMSGDDCLAIADKIFHTKKLNNFSDAIPNTMYLGSISCDGFSDQCLAVYFKAPRSFTGEDVIEFQCHGGVRLTEEVLKAVIKNGATIATRGEFAKRAFLNGKCSLAEAEGMADMINSENIASLNAGYRMLSGHLSQSISELNQTVLDLTALLEASLDYPEEMEDEVKASMPEIISKVQAKIEKLLSTANMGNIIKNGINVAIIGEPNVGKSSLLNAILGRDRAIVTDIAGTTRDTLEERVEVNGIFINFIDTAGIRDASDTIEKIGVDKAIKSAENCDLVLYVQQSNKPLSDDEKALLDRLSDKKIIKVYNKSDLGVLEEHTDGIIVSAKNRENIDNLLNNISNMFISGKLDASGEVITNLRHIDALNRALDSIKSASATCNSAPSECVLIDLRDCYLALGEITGDTASEDIIDRIFAKFCLGK